MPTVGNGDNKDGTEGNRKNKNKYILDTLSIEDIQQAFTDSFESFIVCVQFGIKIRLSFKKIIWKYWLQNGGHFVPTSLFQVLKLAQRDDVMKWKHFPRYWPFVRGIHWSPVDFAHKGKWRGALMSSLICGRMNGWANNREDGDLRRHRPHYDVTVMATGNIHSPYSK